MYQAFVQGTELISLDEVPLVTQVVPLINRLRCILNEAKSDVDKHMLVRYAAGSAIGVLDKYHGLIDDSDMYKVATCEFLKQPFSFTP